MNSVTAPSRAPTSATNRAVSAVRSMKPRPSVCTVSSDDEMVVACTVDGAERVTDLADVIKILSLRRPGESQDPFPQMLLMANATRTEKRREAAEYGSWLSPGRHRESS